MSEKLLDQPIPGFLEHVDFSGLTTTNRNYAPSADYNIVFVPAKSVRFYSSSKVFVRPEQAEASSDEITFQLLAGKWRRETGHYSILQQKVLHPAYQQIIGMGEKALPALLKALDYMPSHWFWALRAISRENPAEDVENVEQAVDAWRKWWSDRHENIWQSGFLHTERLRFQG